MTYNEIKEYGSISEEELKQGLIFLCNPKQKILQKENDKKPTFTSNEKITVNLSFSNNNVRVNFIPIQSHKKKTTEKTDAEKHDDKEIRQER